MASSTFLRSWCAPALLLATACGAPIDDGSTRTFEQEIVGGYTDENTKGAIGLAIDFNGLFFTGHCSGSLLTPNLVLTARHCVALTSGGGPMGSVVCGMTGFSTQGPGNVFLASPATVRPGAPNDPTFYRGLEVRPAPGANDICGYDIALIILEGAGVPNDVAKPIIPRIDRQAERDEIYSAIGYGLEDPGGGGGGTRKRLDDNVVTCSGGNCSGGIGSQVQPTEWTGTSRTCGGDSGGPAVDTEGRVIGVLSRGSANNCDNSVYGDVGSWGEWIIETAKDAAAMGGIDPPFWAVTGESVPPDVTGERCDETCLGDFVCHERKCTPACDASTPCPGELICDEAVGGCVNPPDPLGEECSGACRNDFSCYAASGEPPGICVPACGAGDECPTDYDCSADLGLCLPAGVGANDSGDSGGCGCRSAGSAPAGSSALVLALGLVVAARRRRRAR